MVSEEYEGIWKDRICFEIIEFAPQGCEITKPTEPDPASADKNLSGTRANAIKRLSVSLNGTFTVWCCRSLWNKPIEQSRARRAIIQNTVSVGWLRKLDKPNLVRIHLGRVS